MNDEQLEQHLRNLPAPELPSAWQAEIIGKAIRQAAPPALARSIWPPLFAYLRELVFRNPITAGTMATLWLLIFVLKCSTPADPASARMLLVHVDPRQPLYFVSIQNPVRLALLAQDETEPRRIP